ncbi:hypothetical protein R3P38DRAFT_2998697 [Favolaschia claudopus]|uniref:Uncharacterized protein n=1 Tax=Favolaschia claudopus TaxID=2862362 RepID=A0AAW0APQ6_9AGAR
MLALAPQPIPSTSATAIYSIMSSQAVAVQRLQSPILLDARLRSPICSPHRRRTARPRRRPHCARSDCALESALHPFDRLPWISAMDTPPNALHIADIADLSQLVVDEPLQEFDPPAPGTGPIRRRKTSLRASPLPPKTHSLHDTTPHTPITHINHSRITFHNLMPVLSCDLSARP